MRRPPAYYRGLVAAEREPLAALPALSRTMLAGDSDFALVHASANDANWHAELALLPLVPEDGAGDAEFPPGALGHDGEPLDLRPENSWGL